MSAPLMPKATALWLIDNTTLTFDQIAVFCDIHILEIQAIADGEIALGMVPSDPILEGELTRAEIDRCQADPSAHLTRSRPLDVFKRKKEGKYTPVARRKDRPDGIAWLLRYHPELTDSAIMTLLGTTKTTIEAIRGKTHRDAATIKPHHPVTLGLCTQKDLDAALAKSTPIRTNHDDHLGHV